MDEKKPTQDTAAFAVEPQPCSAEADGLSRELLATTASGQIRFCTGCHQFSLHFGALELELTPRRLLDLHRLMAAQLHSGPTAMTRIRVASRIALSLQPCELDEVAGLLGRCCERASSLLPAISAVSRWVH